MAPLTAKPPAVQRASHYLKRFPIKSERKGIFERRRGKRNSKGVHTIAISSRGCAGVAGSHLGAARE